jgi:hypothetical protein
MSFRSTLDGLASDRPELTHAATPFFRDLNLDQLIDAIAKGLDEYALKPLFYTSLTATARISRTMVHRGHRRVWPDSRHRSCPISHGPILVHVDCWLSGATSPNSSLRHLQSARGASRDRQTAGRAS